MVDVTIKTCSKCKGYGFLPCPSCNRDARKKCEDCKGTGWKICYACNGSGIKETNNAKDRNK